MLEIEVDDVCLLEDGSEREGALGSNAVVSEIERSHSAPLERLAQLGDGLHLVGTATHVVEAAERVAGQVERLQRRVTLEALRESSSSFGTEVVLSQTASTGTEMGAEWCLSGVNGR